MVWHNCRLRILTVENILKMKKKVFYIRVWLNAKLTKLLLNDDRLRKKIALNGYKKLFRIIQWKK